MISWRLYSWKSGARVYCFCYCGRRCSRFSSILSWSTAVIVLCMLYHLCTQEQLLPPSKTLKLHWLVESLPFVLLMPANSRPFPQFRWNLLQRAVHHEVNYLTESFCRIFNVQLICRIRSFKAVLQRERGLWLFTDWSFLLIFFICWALRTVQVFFSMKGLKIKLKPEDFFSICSNTSYTMD